MQIPFPDIGTFLKWTNDTTQQQLTIDDFPVSSNIYAKYDGPEQSLYVGFFHYDNTGFRKR